MSNSKHRNLLESVIEYDYVNIAKFNFKSYLNYRNEEAISICYRFATFLPCFYRKLVGEELDR